MHHHSFERFMAAASSLPPIPVAVVHPCDAASLMGAVDAAKRGIIEPLLVGPSQKIREVAEAANLDLADYEVLEAPHSHAAAERAVGLVLKGRAEALMKGSLHTDELLMSVLNKETGLRTERRLSHCFVIDVPSHFKPVFITDAALNIQPTLDDKADIVQNSIDLAHVVNIERPKVAVLSAVETVSPKIPSAIEAAALSKMADRGQITGGIVDGPIAIDAAVFRESARLKHMESPVGGEADILVVPNIEVGNMLAKSLTFLAGADAVGTVLGARVPIIVTGRADTLRVSLAGTAIAPLTVYYRKVVAPHIVGGHTHQHGSLF